MGRGLSLREINTFVTVADSHGVARAAALLGYTQPAVTLQLQRLEESLGVDLFDRRGEASAPPYASGPSGAGVRSTRSRRGESIRSERLSDRDARRRDVGDRRSRANCKLDGSSTVGAASPASARARRQTCHARRRRYRSRCESRNDRRRRHDPGASARLDLRLAVFGTPLRARTEKPRAGVSIERVGVQTRLRGPGPYR